MDEDDEISEVLADIFTIGTIVAGVSIIKDILED